jgi:hypothetical protein
MTSDEKKRYRLEQEAKKVDSYDSRCWYDTVPPALLSTFSVSEIVANGKNMLEGLPPILAWPGQTILIELVGDKIMVTRRGRALLIGTMEKPERNGGDNE